MNFRGLYYYIYVLLTALHEQNYLEYFIIVLMACGQADMAKSVVVTTKDSITVAQTYGLEPTSFYKAKLKTYQQYLTTLAAADLVSNTKAIVQFKALFSGEPPALHILLKLLSAFSKKRGFLFFLHWLELLHSLYNFIA